MTGCDDMGKRPARRPNRARRAYPVAAVLLAGLLAAGCAQATAGTPSPAERACEQFSISAIAHHTTVTSVPPACRDLTRAEINYAAETALAATAGTAHGQTRVRARLRQLALLLPSQVASVPVQPPAPPPAPGSGRPTGGIPLGIAALIAWLVTAGLGTVMMARWLLRGGLRRALADQRGGGHRGAGLNFAHFGFALTGLVAWIARLATGITSLGWVSFGLVLPTAGLGMAVLFRFLADSPAAAPAPAAPNPLRADAAPAGSGKRGAAGPAATPGQAIAIATAAPAAAGGADGLGPAPAQHQPALLLAGHIVFAVATIMLTLLAAIG